MGCLGPPLRLGALGPGPAGPLDKTALSHVSGKPTLLGTTYYYLLFY